MRLTESSTNTSLFCSGSSSETERRIYFPDMPCKRYSVSRRRRYSGRWGWPAINMIIEAS
jgi:hypothetical protein